MFDYDKYYKESTVDNNGDPTRFSRIANLCKGSVLDIGCCFALLSDYYFGPYTGVDFSVEALKKANLVRRHDAHFIIHDCSDLSNFDFSEYDTIVVTEFLEHFTSDEKILDPIFKNAKPGTRIIVTCPNGPRVPDPSHLRELTIPELRKRFSPYGKVKFYN
ncbi:MAG: class I SAM-dependent methyltransferase [Lutibacter sp.]|jgi:2-polyprenyl-3-methyl-5-hydroxy-6-metoxy-1,4-benzoquinol methylase